jgi:protein SCO1/2
MYLAGTQLSVGLAVYFQSTWLTARDPVGLYEAARLTGRFELETVDGKLISNDNVPGRPLIVFFGFTHCPEICPTTLGELTSLLSDLGEAANEITPIFITVDPERDTAQVLRQ